MNYLEITGLELGRELHHSTIGQNQRLISKTIMEKVLKIQGDLITTAPKTKSKN